MESSGTAVGLELEDLKAIDTVRARLAQLVSSVSRLQGDVFMSNPLPPPESIQASAFVLQQNMASLNEVMAQHADLFRRIVVHPDPSFPGRTEEQVLTSLLRKKLEPDVEQMAEKAREKAEARGISLKSFDVKKQSQRDEDDEDDDDDDDDDDDENDSGSDEGDMFDGPRQPYGLGDIWYDARGWCINQITTFIQEEAAQNYTKAEREQGVENVRTGLKRRLDEDDDDDEDEDDEDEDDEDKMDTQPAPQSTTAAAPAQTATVPPLEPELLLWFASRGDTNLPRYVDIESQRAAAPSGAQRRM